MHQTHTSFFRLERNMECCFSIQKFQIVGEQSVLTEIINLRHCEVHSLYRNCFILPQSVEILVAIMTFDSKIFAQVLYQDQSVVHLIGDVICPNKKCRGEKCVYFTRFEEIHKSIYQCKQCKACSHVLSLPFRDQKPCVTLFGWTYCFRKKTKSCYQNEKPWLLMRQYIHQSKLSTAKAEEANIVLFQKSQRFYLIWNKRVTLLKTVMLLHKF